MAGLGVKNTMKLFRTLLLPILMPPALLALSACSDIVPGLNIREGGAGDHQFAVVKANDGNDYKVVPAGPALHYDVEPIDSNLILQLAQRPAADAQPLPSLVPSDVPPEYRLGPGDVFFVVVWDHPELTAPYTGLTQDLSSQGRLIAADGTTFYPFVGTFKAAGMTATELRTYIAKAIAKVIENPQVDVRIVAYRAGRVEVTGEVVKPSTLTFDDTPKGIIQAIGACGGLTPAASRRHAILVRAGVIHEIDLSGLLSGGYPVDNPALLPGDVLHFPDQSGDQVFVLGAVNKQAPVIMLQDSMTLMEALTQAGGLDVLRGRDSGILVFRGNKTESTGVKANVFALDLSRPEGVLLASEFKLRPRDVVYVKATDFAQYNSVVSTLLPTITSIFELNQLTK